MYINRELSWLEFNQRVLDQAHRRELPLLERIKFMAITASNLDEFFQVRVGGLALLQQAGKTKPDPAGLSPQEQLSLIRARTAAMVQEQYELMNGELLPLLKEAGLAPSPISSLTEPQRAQLEQYFNLNVAPLLTPLALEVDVPPVLPSLDIILALELQTKGESRFVAVALPDALPRWVHYAAEGNDGYVLLEDLAGAFIHRLFPGEELVHICPLRVTRNGDIAVVEEDGGDFAHDMEEVLVARKFSACVRLEVPSDAPLPFIARMASLVGAARESIYDVPGPLRLTDIGKLCSLPGHDQLRIAPWSPCPSASVDPSLGMFDNIAQGDILLHHPFESYEPVVRLVEEAAEDADVLAIKQVLYRTAHQSRFIAALCRAADAGKQVTVLVELKARFDERHNLIQAERLQRSGVQVVYGVRDFKTHAKVLMIVRREQGVLRRYCHFGTGNYNESTARLYSDLSLLTCNEQLGADASQFFNSVTGLTRLMHFRRLFPSPAMMKEKLLALIGAETQRAAQGERAEIRAKMNSLNDRDIMEALDRAANAGVSIRLNVRGICCWAPSTVQAQVHTRIVSIVDRYLEHARIFCFHNGGSPLVYIASADWMSRNLDRRVELMIPIENRQLAHRVRDILDACFRDNTQSYLLRPDGSSQRLTGSNKPFRMQLYLQKQAQQRARAYERSNRQMLEPHRPRTEN